MAHRKLHLGPIRTLLDHRDADLLVSAICAAGHEVQIDIDAVTKGGDVTPDHAWLSAKVCPICGATGASLIIRPA